MTQLEGEQQLGVDSDNQPSARLIARLEEVADRILDICRDAIAQDVSGEELAAIHQRAILTTALRRIQPADQDALVDAFNVFCATCRGCEDPSTKMGASQVDASHQEDLRCEDWAPGPQLVPVVVQENMALIRLNEIREQEARRLGRALHGEAPQLLSAIHLAVEEVAQELDPERRERLRAVRSLLDEAEEKLRCLSHELHPMVLDDFGLQQALELLAEGHSRRSGIPIQIRTSSDLSGLPSLIETALYRIVQEAVNNCMKHASATAVVIELARGPQFIVCKVEDDGVGFNMAEMWKAHGSGHLGLVGIRERAEALGGRFAIHSVPGKGTSVKISIPSPPMETMQRQFVGRGGSRRPVA